MATAVELVRRFRQVRVLVIGDAMLDSYLEGTATRLCSEGPVPVVRKTVEERAPGGAANTAANLRALGAEVVFLGIVGGDVAGRLLRSALCQRDIDDRWLVEDESVSTLHKLRILADGQYVVRFDEGETCGCSVEGRQQLLAHLEAAFPHCDAVVISDYTYGAAADEVIGQLRALRAARPCTLVVDSKELWRFRHAGATVVTPNHLEARLDGEPATHDDGGLRFPEIERIGRRLLAKIDAEYAAITLAGDGVCLVDRQGRTVHLPAHRVAQANDVGAGDSFTAALALALAAGASCEEAARIGIDAAGIAVTKQRTAVVHHQELLQRVSLRDHVAAPAIEGGEQAVALLAARIAAERRAGQTIVFTNGVFDILHAGHVEFLRRAKELGDILVVGVNSDRSARRLKGENRPINSEQNRLALVAALDPVDHAILFDEETPAALIQALRPHVHVKGGDYAGEALPEAEAVHEVGGQVVILPLVGDLSTSRVIDRIVAVAGGPARRASAA
ncbi:MAG: D-glycero-beta-D-manno-heptose 1-phosphate adenylyltransferase [Ardenticatenaceae bacterium]|nr:D-glycero-beta-D-manno-heptose 1-phosphate adenylyltransferase [Ardenticatenaceae bacterium]